ncbi:MAG: DNA topoisomerase-1 [Patiriisocius sp.]|jgi:DNA topoisomerase-1
MHRDCSIHITFLVSKNIVFRATDLVLNSQTFFYIYSMAKNLVIVESPAKAKTIEKYLGKDFTVKSSFGHVRDLKSKALSVDVENGFEPTYEISEDKKKVIDELLKLSKKAEMVWLATDEDREGEAISWHLEQSLGLTEENTKRITFNEITKNAVLKAIQNPRTIDRDLVNAQQARRILDRLVGFELSPVLWKKVKPSLSAGRVQSVAVRIIVEREREIEKFKATESFRVVANFLINGNPFKAVLQSKFKSQAEAETFLTECKGADFNITDLQVKPGKKSPSAPFTTSTLQQEASRKLGYAVGQTMQAAQKLYEAGHITYMRTDSVNLSKTAKDAAKESIEHNFGPEYSKTRDFITKNKGAQEAHEAIRPTNMMVKTLGDDRNNKLYELIWKRAVASQMADAELEKTTATISISTRKENFIATGEVIKFDGFLKLYIVSKDEDEEVEDSGLLPKMNVGEKLEVRGIEALQRFTKHPPRYSEATLVRRLEELGIGRPSTYAPTIGTIQRRGYVEKETREGTPIDYVLIKLEGANVNIGKKSEVTGHEKNKLFPEDMGVVVNDFLVANFEKILSYDFTASVEKQFDDIADGQLKWNKMIEDFYGPFHNQIEHTLEHADKARGERILGKDPKSGKDVVARIGRFGAMIQIGSVEDEDKPRFASLLKEQSIATITFDEAMILFQLPRDLGTYDGVDVAAAIGRFGPYVRFGKLFCSIPKDAEFTPYNITMDQAAVLIEAKKKAEKEKYIKVFPENEDIQVLKGRYGPYIKAGKKNVRIPKDKEPASLTLEECLELAANAPEKKGRGSKAAATKKTTAKKATKKKAPAKKKAAAKKKPAAKKTTKK